MPVINLRVENSNEALIRLGADDIDSFEDGTREAKLCGKIYEKLVEAMTEAFPYTFSKKEMILSKVNNFTPLIAYRYAFALPGDAVRPVYKTNFPGLDYKIVDNLLYTNTEELIVQYQIRPDESKWSPNFKLAFIYKLCQELSVALQDDDVKAVKYEALYEKTARLARVLDSQIQPGERPSMRWYPLVAVRG